MKNKLKKLPEQFNELTIRNRLLITFSSFLFLFLIFDLVWYSSNVKKKNQLNSQSVNIDQKIIQLTKNQSDINAGIFNQRNDPKNNELKLINKQLEKIQQDVEQRTVNLVKPEAMTQLLKEIINQSKKLKLISLVKKEPKLLFEKTKNEENTQINMYQHPVELIFTGSFYETQKFLYQLENMQQKLTFENFEYSVEKYPVSRVTLVVSTLNLSRKWIGG